jgi:hypothetical protein
MSRDHTKLRTFHLADSLVLDIYRETKGFPFGRALWIAVAGSPRGGFDGK